MFTQYAFDTLNTILMHTVTPMRAWILLLLYSRPIVVDVTSTEVGTGRYE